MPEYSKEYYLKNRVRILARNRAWRQANKEKFYAGQKKWSEKNAEKVKGYKRKTHVKHREKFNKAERLRRRKQYREQIARLYELKREMGCSRCPENDPVCLQFHHLDTKTKKFGGVSSLTAGAWETVLKEIKKCILLCANCHFKEHAKSGRLGHGEEIYRDTEPVDSGDWGEEPSLFEGF
jgi:transcription elongation factor Elf1